MIFVGAAILDHRVLIIFMTVVNANSNFPWKLFTSFISPYFKTLISKTPAIQQTLIVTTITVLTLIQVETSVYAITFDILGHTSLLNQLTLSVIQTFSISHGKCTFPN